MNGRRAKELRTLSTSRAHRVLKRAFHKGRISSAQNPAPLSVRNKRAAALIKPTWPRTPDQKAQSRPVIVMRPVGRRLDETPYLPLVVRRIRSTSNQPKHQLDALARI